MLPICLWIFHFRLSLRFSLTYVLFNDDNTNQSINQSILETDSDRRVLLALETQLRDTENKLTAAFQLVTQNTVECRPLNKIIYHFFYCCLYTGYVLLFIPLMGLTLRHYRARLKLDFQRHMSCCVLCSVS